jgi:hypothetical protein
MPLLERDGDAVLLGRHIGDDGPGDLDEPRGDHADDIGEPHAGVAQAGEERVEEVPPANVGRALEPLGDDGAQAVHGLRDLGAAASLGRRSDS